MDPCLDVTCDYYGLCKAFGPYDARCVCVYSCPSYQEPICSSNGTSYDNKCLFEQEMCLLQLNFTVQHPGSCEGKQNFFNLHFVVHLNLSLPVPAKTGREGHGPCWVCDVISSSERQNSNKRCLNERIHINLTSVTQTNNFLVKLMQTLTLSLVATSC